VAAGIALTLDNVLDRTPFCCSADPNAKIQIRLYGTTSSTETAWMRINTLDPSHSGCAVCRIPMASPRCCGGNQPTTRRPLAELLLAAAIPPRNSTAATATREPAAVAAKAAAAVSADPTANAALLRRLNKYREFRSRIVLMRATQQGGCFDV